MPVCNLVLLKNENLLNFYQEKKRAATGGNANNVKVVVRCRPISDKELDNDHREIVFVNI